MRKSWIEPSKLKAMQTTTIEELQKQIKVLEEQKRKAFEDERNAKLTELAKSVGIDITVESTRGSFANVWDDTEIFSIRISFAENIDGIIYGFGCSVGYLVSRKFRKVIGKTGTGHCWLPSPTDVAKQDMKVSPYDVLQNRVIESVNTYLASL